MVAKRVSGRRAPHREFGGTGGQRLPHRDFVAALRHPQPPAAGRCNSRAKGSPAEPGICANASRSEKALSRPPHRDFVATLRHPQPPAAGRCNSRAKRSPAEPGLCANASRSEKALLSPSSPGFRRAGGPPTSPPACGGLCNKLPKSPAQANLAGLFATLLR